MRTKRPNRSSPPATPNHEATAIAAPTVPLLRAQVFEARFFALTVVFVTILVFIRVLSNELVETDGSSWSNEPGFRGLGWRQLHWIFAEVHFGQYQPLAWLSLAIDYTLWWADPFGHHLTNLLLHGVNTALVYRVVLELLWLARAPFTTDGRAWPVGAAAVATLFFAIHPLRVEPVAWASARGELLGATFFFLSLFAFLKATSAAAGASSAASDTQAARWKVVSLSAFFFSLLASSVGIALPVVLFFIECYRLRRPAAAGGGFAADLVRIARQVVPYFVLSVLAIAVALIARRQEVAAEPLYSHDLSTWVLHQLAAPAFYLVKTILPVNLAPAYELGTFVLWGYIAATLLLVAAAVAVHRVAPAVALSFFCFILLMVPFFRVQFPAAQMLADRHTYIAAFAPALLLAAAARRVLDPPAIGRYRAWRRIANAAIITAALALLGVLAVRQVPVWRNPETLWRHAAAQNPTGTAFFNLATLAEKQGKYEEAIGFNRKAVEMDPARWDAHERAALLLQAQGRIADAVEHYRAAVRLNPDAIEARENLAAGLVNQGLVDEAIAQLRKVLKLAPQRNESRFKLGTILAVRGRLPEAAETLAEAVKADPGDGRIRLRLGQALAAQGKLADALPHFREAARLRSDDAEVQENFGRALLELGHKTEAAKHLQEAVRLLRLTPVAR